ncbi:MAG: Cof-type HAD-IIB family hydrolase [Treponema sp.]|nr:Cof-type HAD-IIB family hydrolase [Treponema sp.]
MRFELIAIDLDDTLLHSDLSISQANREALRRAHKAGAKIVLSSGRNLTSMEKYARLLGLAGPDDYIVASNGAEIVATATGRVLFELRLDADLCREIAAFLGAKGFAWQIYENGGIQYHGRNSYTEEDTRLTGMPNFPIADVEAALARGQLKFVVPGEPLGLPPLREELLASFPGRIEVLISKPYFLEILPFGADKGAALSRLAPRLELDMRKALAMGDGMNDIGMLKAAGFSCAPANAVPEAKAAAGWVSHRTNDEDFVADALDRFMDPA